MSFSPCFCGALQAGLPGLQQSAWPPLNGRRFSARAVKKGVQRGAHGTRAQLRGWDGGGAPRPPRCERCPEYSTNVGAVIDTLRIDYPRILEDEINYDIYAPNVVFYDRTGNWVQGLSAYRAVIWAVRTQMRLFFTVRNVAIQSVFHCEGEGAIYLRWRLTVTPRVLALMSVVPSLRTRSLWVYDGLSVYKLNNEGWVCEHSLENNARNRTRVRPLFEDVLSVGRAVSRGRERGTPVGAGAGVGVPSWYRLLENTVFDQEKDNPKQAHTKNAHEVGANEQNGNAHRGEDASEAPVNYAVHAESAPLSSVK